MSGKDVLTKLLFEAKSYNNFEDIEKLVEIGTDLSVIPLQPLYISLLSSSSEQVAQVLPKLSAEQRQAMLDLDLWKRDNVDVESFEFWVEAYSKVQDLELVQQFVGSEDFLIYLKSRVNIYTFDVEDPQYPDHDYYFLTDDSLLLIEYADEYKYANEIKYMVRNLYDRFGVEQGYTLLFKLINDSFMTLQEAQYQQKKERLRDYGFVDFYEAREKTYSFITYKQIDNFILNKETLTPDIDILGKNQSLHSSALVSFDAKMENILKELSLVQDEKRLHFLHFTFIRLINSTIALSDALKGGRVELTRIGKQTRNALELGLQKVKQVRQFAEHESVFNDYDFFDLFRIGQSLIDIEKKKVKKALAATPFDENDYEYFLGAWWTSFLENTFLEIPKVKAFGAGLHPKEVDSLVIYGFWKRECTLFKKMTPFIHSFFQTLDKLKTEGQLHDQFYLNYEVENIDFESILISSFVNFSLGNFSGRDVKKMGITISELKEFFKLYFIKSGEEYILKPFDEENIQKQIQDFTQQYGLNELDHFYEYLYGILVEHLSGYEFDSLDFEDYKHIGGPILLNTELKN